MISLETTFISGDGGYSQSPGPLTYKQVARTDSVAVYQRFYADGRPKDFEVFRIRVTPKGTEQKFPNGVVKVVEDDTEHYPSTGQFGKIAWSFGNEIAAMRRFEQLCKQVDAAEEEDESTPVKAIIVPVGEFTVGEFAEKNNMSYAQACLLVKADKNIQFVREERRNARGKASKLYAAVKTT